MQASFLKTRFQAIFDSFDRKILAANTGYRLPADAGLHYVRDLN